MTRERLEHRLRSEPLPDESAYRSRPLPVSVDVARDRLAGGGGSRLLLATTGVITLALLVVVASAWLTDPNRLGVGTYPSEGPRQGAPAASSSPVGSGATAPCRAADMAVTSNVWDAAAGSRGTRVVLAVVDSVAACVVGGRVEARITDADGNVLVMALSDATQPMTLMGGDAVELGVAWSNWCGAAPAAPLEMTVTLSGDVTPIPVQPPDGTQILVPPCMGVGQSTALSVTRLEPSEGPRPEG